MEQKTKQIRINQIISTIRAKSSIALFVHINPDGDALGSVFAMKVFLEKLGKQCDVYFDGRPTDILCDMEGVQNCNQPMLKKYDLAIALDCADSMRLGVASHVLRKCPYVIVVDHHLSHVNFGNIEYVDNKAAATAEMIYDILYAYDSTLIDKTIAEYLYIGICTDTGIFTFSNVSESTFEVTIKLLGYGIDNAKLNYLYYNRSSKNKFDLKIRVLSKVRFFLDDRVAFVLFSKADFEETGCDSSCTDGIVNELRNIDTVQIAFSITEIKPYDYKVSIRTKGNVNATYITNFYNGGGHINAAGMRTNGFLEDIIDSLVKHAGDIL